MPLEFRSGPRRGESVELGGRIVLVRGEDCDVVLDDDKASRFHTALTPLPDGTVRVEPETKPQKRSHNSVSGVSTLKLSPTLWRNGRVVEGGGLENRFPERERGFESLLLRET